MVNNQKKEFVGSVIKLLESTKDFVLVTFDKTPHQKLEELRKNLAKSGAELQVIKNTLFEKAINKLSVKNPLYGEFKKKAFPLKQITALLVLKDDWSVGLKAFYEYADKEKSLSFKNGVVEGFVYDKDGVLKLAKLPGKTTLIANILGSFKSPTSHFVFAIKNPMQKLVYILNSKAKTS